VCSFVCLFTYLSAQAQGGSTPRPAAFLVSSSPSGFRKKAQSAVDWLVERCKLGHGCDTDGDIYTLADWFTISVHALAYATSSSS